MSFNPNIPQVTDPILQSSRQIKANFQEIASAFSTNHVDLAASNTMQGQHNSLTCRPQNDDPTTSPIQNALYNKLVSGIPQLFYRPNNDQTPIQMTQSSIKVDSSFTQYTFIAGPFYVYAGRVVNPTQGQTVTLSPGTTLLHVDVIPTTHINPTFHPNIFVPPRAIATNLTGTSFNISFAQNVLGGLFDVYYTAIGV